MAYPTEPSQESERSLSEDTDYDFDPVAGVSTLQELADAREAAE